MIDYNEIENECFVLIDTCTFSNIMNGKWGEEEYSAFRNILRCDNKPLVSDLTFIELVEGQNSKEKLRKLINDFLSCEFIVFGYFKEVRDIVQSTDYDNLSTSQFHAFKTKLYDIKYNYLKKIFEEIVRKYCVLYFRILEVVDSDYFGGILNCYQHELFSKQKYNEFVEAMYIDYIKGIISTNNLLFDIANSFGNMLLLIMKSDYREGDIFRYIMDNEIEKNLSRHTNQFINFITTKFPDNFKNNKFKNNQPLFLMEYLKGQQIEQHLSNELFRDAINYVVINAGFCKGKFNTNHLVDLYNVSLVGLNYNFKYYTNDIKWKNFIEIERKINGKFAKKIQDVDQLFYQLN